MTILASLAYNKRVFFAHAAASRFWESVFLLFPCLEDIFEHIVAFYAWFTYTPNVPVSFHHPFHFVRGDMNTPFRKTAVHALVWSRVKQGCLVIAHLLLRVSLPSVVERVCCSSYPQIHG